MITNKKTHEIRRPALCKRVLFASAVCLWKAAAAADDPSPPWPTDGWETTTPAAAGMQESLLEDARAYALTGGGAGMVTRGGRLVYAWGDAGQRFDLKSSSKSIGVTVLGLALQDGRVSLTDSAQMHLPSVGLPPQANAGTGWLDDITLLQLATHTAGFNKSGGFIDVLFAPGTAWSYSDGGANWLADVLTVRYGEDLKAVLFERVFDSLGIRSNELIWRNHRYRGDEIEGIKRREFGSGIKANVDAMARIGYLYLRHGAWDGERILPPDFVATLSRPIPDVVGLPVTDTSEHAGASNHYGLLWWNNGDGSLANVPRDAFWSWGLRDSLIIVVPSLDIVVARAGAGWRPGWDSRYAVLEPFLDPIARAVNDVALSRPPVVRIDAPVDGASSPADDSLTFEGRATDAEDGNLAHALTWVSDRDGPIGTGAALVTSALSAGAHVITASVADSGGLVGATNVVISIGGDGPGNAAPAVVINMPADHASFAQGDSVHFGGTAQDTEEGNLSAGLSWRSSRDRLLGSGASLSVTTLSPGTHTITAEVSDGAGAQGSDAIEVMITPAGGASTLTLPASADTFGNKGKRDTNFGRMKIVRAHGPNEKKVAFIRFDTAGLGGAVSAAELELFVKDVKKAGVLDVHAVLADWEETALTHRNMPAYGPAVASVALSGAHDGTGVSLDVTGLVQQWAGSPSTAFGIALTSQNLHVIVQTRETPNAPEIVVHTDSP